jgi:CRP-like cAMP-binding protein
MALLENRPRSATVVALDALRLLGINRQAFQRWWRTPAGHDLMAQPVHACGVDEDRSQAASESG